jgi:hypothetical protein
VGKVGSHLGGSMEAWGRMLRRIRTCTPKGREGGKRCGTQDPDLLAALAQLPEPYRSRFYDLSVLSRYPSAYSQTYADRKNCSWELVFIVIGVFAFALLFFTAYYWNNLAVFGAALPPIGIGDRGPKDQWDLYVTAAASIAAAGAFVLAGVVSYFIVRGQAVFSYIESRVTAFALMAETFPNSFRLLQQIYPVATNLQLLPDPTIADPGKQAFTEIQLIKLLFSIQEDQLLVNRYPLPADVREMNHILGSPLVQEQYQYVFPGLADTQVAFYNINVLPFVRTYDPAEPPIQRARLSDSPYVPYTTRQADCRNFFGDPSILLVVGVLLFWLVFAVAASVNVAFFVTPVTDRYAWWTFLFTTTNNLFVVATLFMAGLAFFATTRAADSQLNLRNRTQSVQSAIAAWPYSLRPEQQLNPTNRRLQTIAPPPELLPLDLTTQVVLEFSYTRGLLWSMWSDISTDPYPRASSIRNWIQWYTAQFMIRNTRELWDEVGQEQREVLERWVFPIAICLAPDAWEAAARAPRIRPHALPAPVPVT